VIVVFVLVTGHPGTFIHAAASKQFAARDTASPSAAFTMSFPRQGWSGVAVVWHSGFVGLCHSRRQLWPPYAIDIFSESWNREFYSKTP